MKIDNEAFNALVEERLEATRQMLVKKGSEYASNGDRLHNFDLASRLMPDLFKTDEDSMLAYGTKHFGSILDIMTTWRNSGNLPDESVLREKFGDWINYMILIELSLIYTQRLMKKAQ